MYVVKSYAEDVPENKKENLDGNTVNADDIRKHLNKMVIAISDFINDGKIIIASYGEDPCTGIGIIPKVEHFGKDEVEKMLKFIERLSLEKNRNVYMPLVLMKSGLKRNKKGGEDDILAVFGLCADFDDGQASEYLERLPLEPDFVLETSKDRFQAVYSFDKPIDPKEAKIVAAMLKQYADCDHGTSDISHVWRTCGTFNWPNQKKVKEGRSTDPQIVKLAYEKKGSPGTSFDELREKLEKHSPQIIKKNNQTKIIPLPVPKQKRWAVDIDDFPVKSEIKDLILNGCPKGKRSEAIWKVILSLLANGCDDLPIVNLILTKRIGEKAHEKRNPDDWLNKQIQKAHEWLDANPSQFKPAPDLEIIDKALLKCKETPESVFEENVIQAFANIKKNDPTKYGKYRTKIKAIKGISIGSVEQ